MWIKKPLALLALTAVVSACAGSDSDTFGDEPAHCAGDGCVTSDPWQPGPFPVGVRDDLYMDTSREALAWRGCGQETCPRPIKVSIWYPAARAEGEPMKLIDFLEVTAGTLDRVIGDLVGELGGTPPDVDIADKELAALRNAPLRAGRYPLVVFSHGAGGVRFQSIFLTEYLASHGFIVISPDHEGDATLTVIRGEVVTVQTREFIRSALERPLDVAFLIDRMGEADTNSHHWLHGAVDASHVGLTGHSFGAFTSLTLAGQDRRIGAIVPQAAPGFPSVDTRVPSLFMLAGEDDTIEQLGNDGMIAEYDIWPEPKGLISLLDAGHFTYSNMCDLIPSFGDGCGDGKRLVDRSPITYVDPTRAHLLINGYTTAWFQAWLKNIRPALNALNAPPVELADVRRSAEFVLKAR